MISIVDDDAAFCRAIGRFIRSLGHEVSAFASAEEFLGSGRASGTRCLISDVQMPGGMNGLELQKRLIADGYRFPIIFVASDPDAKARGPALNAGALAFLNKPFNEGELISSLEKALSQG
jgi:FixJ family two-component response regulator